ncbi:MAG: hypothetical protein IJZ35_02880 [Clostridia bacterium]|nr:hypothetical protein [Clostridia bacterium]
MKKILSLVLSLILLSSVCIITAYADDSVIVSESIEYLDDGTYVVTTLTVEDDNSVARATSTKTGSKTITLYNSDDEALVTMKLTASFSYTGSSATCISASTSYTIHNSNWKVTSATASKSGNKATGNFTAKKYLLGIPIQTKEHTLTITCSNTGTLS